LITWQIPVNTKTTTSIIVVAALAFSVYLGVGALAQWTASGSASGTVTAATVFLELCGKSGVVPPSHQGQGPFRCHEHSHMSHCDAGPLAPGMQILWGDDRDQLTCDTAVINTSNAAVPVDVYIAFDYTPYPCLSEFGANNPDNPHCDDKADFKGNDILIDLLEFDGVDLLAEKAAFDEADDLKALMNRGCRKVGELAKGDMGMLSLGGTMHPEVGNDRQGDAIVMTTYFKMSLQTTPHLGTSLDDCR
jgi:hypothetical protein